MKRFPVPSFVLVPALLAGTVWASPQHIERPVLSAVTSLVTLAVTVSDEHGRPVTNLRREQFAVFDNGEHRTIDFFTSEDVPATVGLVMDNSGSMRGRRENIVPAATAFAAMSHPLDEFFTVNFNDSVWRGLATSVAFTSDPDQLRAALFTTPAEGMSALYDAVGEALDHLQQGRHDRRALIVVSDGGDNASSKSFDAIVEQARRSRAVIYAVTLSEPDDHDARPRVLKKLAAETGGHAYTPRTSEEVARAFARIGQMLRRGYTLGFVPSESGGDGFRLVRVTADAGDGRKLVARTRAGYYVNP